MSAARVVTIVVAAGLLVGCGASDPGAELYSDLGCARCHGKSGQGNRYGPPLADLDELWPSESELVRYLQDPKAVVEGNPRLQRQAGKFNLMMLPVKDASEKQLHVLAAWLRQIDNLPPVG